MDTSSWKVININQIFDISYGNKLDMCQMTLSPTGIPFVTRTSTNNGVGGVVEPLEGVEPYPAGSLSIALGGSIGSTFLQTKDFYTSQNVAVLQPKYSLSKDILLFLATLIEKECSLRFVAFGRELNKHIKRDFTIKLPLTKENTPNWELIENQINTSIIPLLPIKARNIWQKQYDISPVNPQPIQLNTRDWQWFHYDEIFDIKHGFYNKKPEDNPNGDIPFIGATDSNNGVTSHSDIETIAATTKTGDGSNSPLDEKIFENCIAVTNNGSVGYAYYQEKRFTCTHDVNPLYLKGHKLNRYIALFLCTLIEKERFRWAYGRKWRPVRMPSSRIKLPVTPTGEPDWQFMEDYIKSLSYSRNIESTDPNELVNALQKKVKELEQQLQQQSHSQTPFTNYGTVNIIDNSRNYNIK